MKIAVVILNWNGKKLLEQFLPTVIACSEEASVVVADNASIDDSVTFVKEHFPQVQIVQNKTNGGYAKGYNDALLYVDADVFCLLNSDIEVTKGWLQPIISLYKTDEKISIIQPKILAYNQKNKFEYAGAGGGFIDKYGYPFCRGRIFNTLEEDNGQYNNNLPIFWASGACMFIKRSVFNELGGFDEAFFAHQEEIDLCWRAHNNNYKVWYCGASTVYHVGGATLNEASTFKTYLNFRNSLFNLTKNLPKKKLFPVIFTRLILDGLAAIQFLCKGKPKHVTAILKAHFSFYKQLSSMFKKRKFGILTKDYYYKKSIVWCYFVNKKKYFPEL
jgi:hypothetical protein